MKKDIVQKTEKPLSKKEEIFLNEYLIDFNCCRAAVAAGYALTTGETIASQWVTDGNKNNKPHLTAAIKRRMQERAEKTGITIDRIESELAIIAFASVPSKTILTRDKIAALELLGKRRGMFKESIELSGNPLIATGIAVYIPDNGRNDDSGK